MSFSRSIHGVPFENEKVSKSFLWVNTFTDLPGDVHRFGLTGHLPVIKWAFATCRLGENFLILKL